MTDLTHIIKKLHCIFGKSILSDIYAWQLQSFRSETNASDLDLCKHKTTHL